MISNSECLKTCTEKEFTTWKATAQANANMK